MPSPLRVSVVIPTCNRKARLRRVLDALARQSVEPDVFEVVIVDDGSSDGTSDALAALHTDYALRSFFQPNAGPARARNRGVQEARGELVLFLDDDVMPEPCLIAEHLGSHGQEAASLVVMGPLASLPHYDQPWVSWEQAKIEAQYRAMLDGVYAPTFRQFWTGNASLERAHLLEVGGFNHEFPRGEDVELGARLHKRGLQFRFNPRAVGYHHAERSLESWAHAHRSYGRLEVEIFGQLSEDQMLDTLAGNFSRLHPGTRLVLRSLLLAAPRMRGAAELALTTWLTSRAANVAPGVSSKVCSVLANLLYWQESASALGAARLEKILARADRMLDGRPFIRTLWQR
jgi:glycosyltransferase involved in cell wall biosynthesis